MTENRVFLTVQGHDNHIPAIQLSNALGEPPEDRDTHDSTDIFFACWEYRCRHAFIRVGNRKGFIEIAVDEVAQ